MQQDVGNNGQNRNLSIQSIQDDGRNLHSTSEYPIQIASASIIALLIFSEVSSP